MLEEMETRTNDDVKSLQTAFRELARAAEHIPEVSYFKDVVDSEPEVSEDGDWTKGQLKVEESNLERPIEVAIPGEAGVYTEGGLVYLPGQAQDIDSGELFLKLWTNLFELCLEEYQSIRVSKYTIVLEVDLKQCFQFVWV